MQAGRLDDPRYKTALAVMRNYMPGAEMSCIRRPGFKHLAFTRFGEAAKLISWRFASTLAYVAEFGDANVRFWQNGALRVTTDEVVLTSISAADPAVFTVDSAFSGFPSAWADGDFVVFQFVDVVSAPFAPELSGREFSIVITKPALWASGTTYASGAKVLYNGVQWQSLSSGNIGHNPASSPTFWIGVPFTQATLYDSITGTPVDGTDFSGTFNGAVLTRRLDVFAPWSADQIAALRKVQSMIVDVDRGRADSRVTFLHPDVQPQSLSSLHPFSEGLIAEQFFDGPYLDPPSDPASITPDATTGLVKLTFSGAPAAWAVGTTYAKDAVVGFIKEGIVYYSISLVSGNVGNDPAAPGATAYWAPEPSPWSSALTYGKGAVVVLNESIYYSLVASNINLSPDTHPQDWSPTPPPWVFLNSTIGDYPVHVYYLGAVWKKNETFSGTDAPPSDSTDEWYRLNYEVILDRFPGVNDGRGFSADDIGRCIRLLCAPAPWDGSTAYTAGQRVLWNGLAYIAKDSSTGVEPDQSLSKWSLDGPGVAWRWGRIAFVYCTSTSAIAAWSAGSYGLGVIKEQGGEAYVSRVASNSVQPPLDGKTSSNWLHAGTFADFSILTVLPVTLWVSGTRYNMGDLVTLGSTTTIYVATANNLTGGDIPGVSANWLALSGNTTTSTGGPNFIYAQIEDDDLPDTGVIYSWRLGLYSDATGWPSSGFYHEGRLWFAGPIPNRVDAGMSNVAPGDGGQFRFSPTNPDGSVADNNALDLLFNFEDQNDIYGFGAAPNGLVAFTLAGEVLISASSFDDPVTPTSIQIRRASNYGAHNAESVRVPSASIFVHARQRKVLEHKLFVDTSSSSQSYDAVDLTQTAKDLTEGITAELAFQTERLPVIWARNEDGGLFGVAYKRDPEQRYTAPFAIDHGAERAFVSIATMIDGDGTADNLWTVTENDGIHDIEILTDTLDEDADTLGMFFVDEGVQPTGAKWFAGGTYGVIRFYGLWPLVGETVAVFVGADLGDATVSVTGTLDVTLTADNQQPFVDAVTVNPGTTFGLPTGAMRVDFSGAPFAADLPVVVEPEFLQMQCAIGFVYNSDGQLLRPLEGGANGPAFAKTKRINRAAWQIFRVHEMKTGTNFTNLRPFDLRTAGGVAIAYNGLRTGVYRDTLESKYDFDTQIAWRQTRPWPGVILVVGGFGDVVDV